MSAGSLRRRGRGSRVEEAVRREVTVRALQRRREALARALDVLPRPNGQATLIQSFAIAEMLISERARGRTPVEVVLSR